MPFVSQAQQAACYAQERRDLKAGHTPKWDCHDYAKKSTKKKKKTKTTKTKRRIVPLSEIKRRVKGRERGSGKVRKGPRGGRYVIHQGHKVYI